MEWSIPVNEMFSEYITKLNYTLVPPGFHGDVRAVRTMQESLTKLIDSIGEQSAAAQGLNRVITTAEKLRNSPSHSLYLLKDANARGGQGDIIGMLKVGHKHLFLFDERDQVREVEPLCVLDFYVVPSRQRSGYGRSLFDYMLTDQEVNAYDLAIDGPSSKMEKFLAKNYGVDRLMRQNNNFAVAPQFFEKLRDDASGKSGRSTPAVAAAVGRFAAPKPHSAIATVIHGGTPYYAGGDNGLARCGDLFHMGHTGALWRQVVVFAGDSSEREEPVEEDRSDSALSDELRLPEPLPWSREAEPVQDWDAEIEEEERRQAERARAGNERSPERPSTLPVEPEASAPPAAPAAFADVPAAGLPSGASTPAAGTARRDSQVTDKGYFDIKFYHNRLW